METAAPFKFGLLSLKDLAALTSAVEVGLAHCYLSTWLDSKYILRIEKAENENHRNFTGPDLNKCLEITE